MNEMKLGKDVETCDVTDGKLGRRGCVVHVKSHLDNVIMLEYNPIISHSRTFSISDFGGWKRSIGISQTHLVKVSVTIGCNSEFF